MIARVNIKSQQNNNSFVCIYRVCDDHVVLMREYGTTNVAVIPESIDGKPVTEVDAYCFASSNRLSGDALKESDMINASEEYEAYHELSGEYVIRVVLPDTVTSVGSYCFYNCRKLTDISIGAGLTSFGSDVFMNCTRLTSVHIDAYSDGQTGLKFLLSQLNQGVNVSFKDGIFYYPEYIDSYEEIGPAHIFELRLEGEGYRARQCFNNGVIDIARYDEVFKKASGMENVTTLFKMAVGRLGKPVLLKSEARQMYTEYLTGNGHQIMEIVVHSKDRESLDFLCDSRILNNDDYVYGQKLCVGNEWTYGSSKILTMDKDKDTSILKSRRHIQTESEWKADIGKRITEYVRGEIYLDLRYMENSLTALVPCMNDNISVYGTDGMYIYFNSDKLCELLKKNVLFLQRVYLHSVLHCIYSHLWIRGSRNKQLWNLACDISVEYILDRIDKACTRRIISWTRQKIYEHMKENGIVSAAQVYNWIITIDDATLNKWYAEFYTDDHVFWPDDNGTPQSPQAVPDDVRQQWEDRARQDELKRNSQGGDKDNEEEILASIRRRRNRYSYSEFLKRFTQLREEMVINPEEFDLSYYSFGLRTYGNIPLIEPLETRESRKIYEFVIVLDTSYSTSGELIRRFLNETLSMLSSDNTFFEQIRLHIIQCDDKVTKDIVLENVDDIDTMFGQFTIKGGGNTDFRPAFNYINQMLENGEFDNLGGVIYFTDGKGIYPMKMPDYKTAFVYFKEIDLDTVPAWAVTYRLDDCEEIL